MYSEIRSLTGDNERSGLNIPILKRIKIPVPPLSIQREIVAEIESYQKIIDGARQVVDNYKPRIDVKPEWPMVELGNAKLFNIESGGTPDSKVEKFWNGNINWVTLVDLPQKNYVSDITSTIRTISPIGLQNSSAKLLPINTVLVSTRATIGRIAISRIPLATNQGFKNIIIQDKSKALPEFVAYMIKIIVPKMQALASGGTFKEISKSTLCTLKIPLPSLEIQQSIVAEIDAELALVGANHELICRFEKKIQTAINRVWGIEPTEE
jgi:type I restriction enzyme M protein